MKAQLIPLKQRGFALIATISVLVLLTLVAVAFLSLSALTVKSSRSDWAQEEARANARLGLMLALGELQREMGPDRRVSASASILDNSPDTLQVDGVDHPNWLGVFSTEFEETNNENQSPWTRSDETDGGMRDARYADGKEYRARDAVKGYLVSGNEGGRKRITGRRRFLDARDADIGDGDEIIQLIGQGTVDDPLDEVLVRKMPTEKRQLLPNGKEEYRAKGSYGFWIGSLGARAAISVADRHRDQQIDASGRTSRGVQRLINAQDVEAAVIDGIADVVEDEASKIITTNSLALVHPNNLQGLRENYHAITGYSRGVLANVRDGGLRRDLTAYILSDGEIKDLSSSAPYYLGLQDSDVMVGPMNQKMGALRGFDYGDSRIKEIAPTFGVIREWYEFSQTNSFSRDRMMQKEPLRWNVGGDNDTEARNVRGFYDNNTFQVPAIKPFSQPNITPLLSEANIFYNLATYSEGTAANAKWVLRLCIYPRVALWNPYSVELETPPLICQLFVNGNKRVTVTSQGSATTQERILYFGHHGSITNPQRHGSLSGLMIMQIPAAKIPAGQTLVFSPAQASPLDPQVYSNNLLSTAVAPSPSRYFYVDYTNESEKFDTPPKTSRETPNADNGGDNFMVALKQNPGVPVVNANTLRDLTLFSVANISLQAGGGDERPLQSAYTVDINMLAGPTETVPEGVIPGRETRDGFRLRWWNETDIGPAAPGELASRPEHMQSAALANWNLRGAYYTRTPFDNINTEPPYHHGIYTRDLPSNAVAWQNMSPVLRNGQNTTFPFSAPNDGPASGLIAFELPSKDVGVPSIAYLRHLKLSEFAWHPSYAIGNSLVDPRIQRTGTIPELEGNEKSHGWNATRLGAGSTAPPSSKWWRNDYWAWLIRSIVFFTCEDSHLVYDQSFEVNYNLWDDFFVSTGTENQKSRFAQDPAKNPLPNGRYGVFDGGLDLGDDIQDFYRAASRLSLEGAFDVHSTSKQAWKAILSSTRDIGFGSKGITPYPRMLKIQSGDYLGERINEAAFSGFRSLRNDEIDRLAEAIVREVKIRAPFFGLADFVNRRLTSDETGREGTLEAAINRAGVNNTLIEDDGAKYKIDRSRELPNFSLSVENQAGSIADATSLRQQDKPPATVWGIPGYLTQGDVLQIIGSSLSARSDSFVIRSYGESKDVNGKILARAWCEATVQRTPEPMAADTQGLNPKIVTGSEVDFGRRFRVVSFRWLGQNEI